MSISRRHLLQSAAAGATVLAQRARSDAIAAVQPQIEPLNLKDYEVAARGRISQMAWEYISGGAGDERSLRWNEEAFDQIRLQPRSLVDVSKLDTSVKLFGAELPHPIILAPAAYHKLVHPEGEVATARGADRAKAVLVVSTLATSSIEEIAAVTRQPLWFQLYVQPDRGFTRELVKRAESAGCKALVITVDTPVVGLRFRELRVGFALPAGMDRPHLKGLKNIGTSHLPPENSIYSAIVDPKLTWKDIEWIRSFARVPIILKGILNPDDAERAVQAGVSGVIVSNHGARNLDTVPATIEVLPRVTSRIAGRIPVLMDSGIRRGTDVLKAIGHGASAVLIGRPYLYGLGSAGSAGVTRVIELLRKEFEISMALTGHTSIGQINSSVIFSPPPCR